MIETATLQVLQVSGDVIPSWTEGNALLYVGLFIGITLLVMKLRSALAILSWALLGFVLVLVILETVTDDLYFITMALVILSIGATGAYNASRA